MARVLCAEIGQNLIKICEMDYKMKSPKVYSFLETETPKDAITDGYMSADGISRLQEAIKAALTSNQIKTKKIAFTVVSGKIINREITIPAVKPTMIADMIQTNLTEYFPIDLSEYETTYSLLETIKEGPEAGKHRVLISAMEKSLVEQYKKLAEGCGLSLANIFYGGDSVFQAVKDENDDDTCAVVKVEENHSVITVVKKGQLMLQRNIPYGIGEAIELILNQGDNKLDSYLEVWQMCSRENMTRIDEFKEVLTIVVNGVARIIDFYNSRHREDEIVRVSLVGIGAEVMGFRDIFRDELNMPCHLLTRINRAVLHTNSTEKTLGTFVACVGSGLAVDGFYHDVKGSSKKAETNYGRLSVLVGVFFLALSAGMAFLGYMSYAEQVLEAVTLEAQKVMYAPGLAAYEQYSSAANLLNDLRYGDMLTKHQNAELIGFLEELERKMPDDILFKEFGSDDTGVTMTLVVSDKEKAAKVIETLRGFHSLMQVSVNSLVENEKKEEGRQNIGGELKISETEIDFTVECLYMPVEAMDGEFVPKNE